MSMIPRWDAQGLLPPIRPGESPTGRDRTPYRTEIVSFVERFALTHARVDLLDSLLRYRAALRDAGLLTGFQWLNGSFVEHTEITRGKAPKDIDVVTFFELPSGETQQTFLQKNIDLLHPEKVQNTFGLDAYPQLLGNTLQGEVRGGIIYWYSMWAHTRDGIWKGFVEIDLDTSQDADAQFLLVQKREGMSDA